MVSPQGLRFWKARKDTYYEFMDCTVYHFADCLAGWGNCVHVAGSLIHLLLVLALISLVAHFVTGTEQREGCAGASIQRVELLGHWPEPHEYTR